MQEGEKERSSGIGWVWLRINGEGARERSTKSAGMEWNFLEIMVIKI